MMIFIVYIDCMNFPALWFYAIFRDVISFVFLVNVINIFTALCISKVFFSKATEAV